jgi:hypothetical protein
MAGLSLGLPSECRPLPGEQEVAGRQLRSSKHGSDDRHTDNENNLLFTLLARLPNRSISTRLGLFHIQTMQINLLDVIFLPQNSLS